jgi:flagellar motility protein MotE (MotC chaperone)
VGLITEGGYILAGTSVARAQEEPSEFTESDQSAADRASGTLFSRADQTPISSSQIDAVPFSENNAGDKIAIGSADGVNETEKAVLERLSERRTELDLLSVELETRASLVEAAEQRLADRIKGLEEIEARISALVDEKKALDDKQFKGLVGMYETMKPAAAASIFDNLSMNVLLRVARSMNPKKMAPVLAKMSTDRARELTQKLASVEPEPAMDAPLENTSDLPQIVGE